MPCGRGSSKRTGPLSDLVGRAGRELDRVEVAIAKRRSAAGACPAALKKGLRASDRPQASADTAREKERCGSEHVAQVHRAKLGGIADPVLHDHWPARI